MISLPYTCATFSTQTATTEQSKISGNFGLLDLLLNLILAYKILILPSPFHGDTTLIAIRAYRFTFTFQRSKVAIDVMRNYRDPSIVVVNNSIQYHIVSL